MEGTNGNPAKVFVTREEFTRVTDDMSEEIGQTHGLVQNFVREQQSFLVEQRERDERRDRLYFEKLERLQGEQRELARKTGDSFSDLSNEAVRAENMRLALEVKRSESIIARHRSWWMWLIRGAVGAACVVGWEVLKYLLHIR